MLERSDRLPEGFAVLGVLQRVGEDLARTGDGTDGYRQPLGRQVVHQVVEALVHLAQNVLHRHPDVGEVQFRGVLRVLAHLVQLAAAFESRHSAFDDQQGEPLVPTVRISPGDNDDQVGVDACRDEGLGAVEHPVVAVEHCGRLDAGKVATRTGLAHRDGADQLAGGKTRKPALLLFVVGQFGHVGPDHIVLQAQCGRRGPELRQLFDDHGVETEILHPTTTELLRQVETDQPVFAGGEISRPVDLAFAFPLLGMRCDLPFNELAGCFPQLIVLCLEYSSTHRVPSQRHSRLTTVIQSGIDVPRPRRRGKGTLVHFTPRQVGQS